MKKKRKKSSLLSIKIRKVYDKSLDQFEGKILFPEKVAQANELLKKVKFPDGFFEKKSK